MAQSEKPKPIHRPKIGVRSIWRVPDEGPVIPRLRLQKKEGIQAIGFTAKLTSDDDE